MLPAAHQAIEKRSFGNLDMQVSGLGLGGTELGFEHLPDRGLDALLGAAFDAGLNVIDTAECYAGSEQRLGRTLGTRRRQCFLFTKCGHAPRPGAARFYVRAGRKMWQPMARAMGRVLPDWNPLLLQRSIDRSLRRLRTEWIDLIQLHSCSEETLRGGEAIDVLQRARQAGKVRYIGYSGDGRAALYAVECGQFDALQTTVNIADQEALDLTLPLAHRRGMGVIAKRPVANAVWKNKQLPELEYHHVYWNRLQALDYDFLRDPGSAMETALRFTLSAVGVHTAIVGTTKLENFRRNVEIASAGPLDAARMESIRARWREVSRPDWVGQV